MTDTHNQDEELYRVLIELVKKVADTTSRLNGLSYAGDPYLSATLKARSRLQELLDKEHIKGKAEGEAALKAREERLVREARVEENESMKDSVTHGYTLDGRNWCVNHEKYVSQCHGCKEAKWGNIFCKKFEAIIDEHLTALTKDNGGKP